MALNIIICIKSVVLTAPDGRVVRLPDTTGLNPFDRPAIEIGLRLKEEKGGTITVVTMGPDSAVFALYEAMSMGVDKAVLISDRALAGSDTLATSKALCAAIKKLQHFDLVLFGARSSDSDTGQVGPQTAVLLDLPFLTGTFDVKFKDADIVVERGVDEFLESYEISLPACLAVHATAVQPRDVKLSGIEKAFGITSIEKMNLGDLGLLKEAVGDDGSPTKIVSLNRAASKKKCEFIEGTVEEQADELVRILKETGYIG
jgi:electron transfer flavoprotein beta subunit